MKTFTDNAGNTWSLSITVDAVKRVRSLLSVNLMDVIEGTLLEKLSEDPVLLCDVLFAVVKPEADAKGITDEQFGRAMGGDAIEAATAALLDDLVDFFPSQRRKLLGRALAKFKTFEEKAMKHANAKLDALDDAAMNRLLNTGGEPSGNSPASSASPPAP